MPYVADVSNDEEFESYINPNDYIAFSSVFFVRRSRYYSRIFNGGYFWELGVSSFLEVVS